MERDEGAACAAWQCERLHLLFCVFADMASQLILQPPKFYMYSSAELPLFHEQLSECIKRSGRFNILDDQHTTGYWLHQQLVTHSARVQKAEEAALFVIPIWMKVSWMIGVCNGTDHLSRVELALKALNATRHFRRHSKKHLLASSSFMMRQPPISKRKPEKSGSCIGAWDGPSVNFRYFPSKPSFEAIVRQLTVAHMERPWPHMCHKRIPGLSTGLYLKWMPIWWGPRTVVLPCAVDAA